jgi:TonB family protein
VFDEVLVRKQIVIAALLLVSTLMFGLYPVLAQSNTDAPRKILTRVMPQYPGLARTMNIQGTVRADVLVAPNGSVKSVEVKGGHPLLCQSAQEALRQWKWGPAAHESHESVELRFTP